MFDIDKSPLPTLLGQQTSSALSTDRSTRAGTPGSDRVVDELARLRRRVSQQDHALARLAEALQALRAGSQALRDENRELRRQLELRPGAERCPPA